MKRRTFLQTSTLAATGWLGGCASIQTRSQTSKPNIIFIMADDQGYNDLGCFGSPTISTPNIDQMAQEGMRFTSFYSSAPMCTPTRASLMTGCFAPRIGLGNGVLFPESNIGINSSELTIAELLKQNGYKTACIGKWHLGHQHPFLPLQHGFDEYFGIPYSNDMSRDKGLPLMRGNEIIERPTEQPTLTPRYTEEAVRFITQNKDQPFFLYLPHTFPHLPWYVSDEFRGKSKHGLYGDMIEEIDWSTGEILRILEELGIDENTLVIYTSDNGPRLRKGGGSAYPFRGEKGETYEGGVRVPTVMQWKGKIAANSDCDEMGCSADILPTISRLTGSTLPIDRKLDGVDLSPLMMGYSYQHPPRKAFYYYNSHYRTGSPCRLEAVRFGDWKYHFAIEKIRIKTRNKYVPHEELYNLKHDIREQNNLIDQYRDIADSLRGLGLKHQEEITRNARPVGRL